ncbi:putative bifunctional diguanylate cyclase/phosphodiesterase [Dyella caseinilytica]|uniref:EAL domain-containing protein n=1 Tax=Dyella caseinilytica TaxID=1849581 RepID=A0ABX7GP25_9GAMM|nr:EAL domain-containing protein [Dyella caseinilytica]QRN52101.1 EAL domain-containing protein [Dyella caseinilytica]
MPLAYGLAAVVGLVLCLTWGALQVQVTLAGFLNGESLWSKAQKQTVIDLYAYAQRGDPARLESFKRNYEVVRSDRWARDAIAKGHYDKQQVANAFKRGGVIPAAIPGMIFILDHFSHAPYMGQAITDWRSVDSSIEELNTIAGELQQAYQNGKPSEEELARQSSRIDNLNGYIQPRSDEFSLDIALGAAWLGGVLFAGTLAAALVASLLWFRMAQRILASIRGTEEKYRLLFDSAADAIVMVDETHGKILGVNRTASVWTGRDPQELVGMNFLGLFAEGSLRAAGTSTIGLLRAVNGVVRTVETHSSLTTWGNLPVRQAIMRDISDRVAMEQERRIASEAMASVAEGIIIADAERRVTTVNGAHTRITGYTLQYLQHHRFDELRRMPDGSSLPSSIWDMVAEGGNWVGEVQSWRSDGSSYPELLSISAIRNGDGHVQHYVAVITDITRSKADRQRLEYMVAHDPLTGLANRSEFQRHCAHAIEAAARMNGAAAVLFVDLDAFKAVNDSYSHAIGDRLLVKVAQRIRRELGENDVASRIGGDEFTVLLGGLRTREQAAQFAIRLLQSLSEPMLIGDYEIVMSASIGIAGYPLDGSDPVVLIANADAAMYAAKTQERNTFRFYTPLMHADARMRLMLGADLRQALMRDEFHLVFQPSVELRTGRIVAVEALLRWRHPERGELMPDEFIPLAESLGLIRRIDAWTMRAVCAQVRHWDQLKLPSIRVALNASAATFGHPGFIESVKQSLQSSQISPKRLMFEITESAILRLGEATEQTMHALHALGVGIAIDDFGTGYSSLAYLKMSGIDYLKIDRSFVTDLPDSTNDVAIVEAMLAIARSLGICTIAEGIETAAQHDFLLRAGCVEGQGYYYSRGLPATEIERMLSPNPRHESSRLRLVPPK